MMNPKPDITGCAPGDCGCEGGVDRRTFLRLTSASTLALLAGRLPVMAGPFDAADFDKLVPADKKLDPEWVTSLFARGVPSVYRGADLQYIGMPIGGICAGQLYLGGDGKLWHWDIFNRVTNSGGGGPHYANPSRQSSPLEQRFTLKLGQGENARSHTLDAGGFSDISFSGQYPVGTVRYKDAAAPVEVTLEAFSPFNPLDTDNSSLPATVMRFTVRNISNGPVEAILTGALENAVCIDNRNKVAGSRRIRAVAGDGFTFLECTAEKTAAPGGSAAAGQSPVGHPFEKLPDYGTMGLALLGDPAEVVSGEKSVSLADHLSGELGRKLTLDSGQSVTVTFVIAWFFPNLESIPAVAVQGRYYASRFDSALAVAKYVARNIASLTSRTFLWRDTWYDSTLPHWFLDRTFLNASILASSTSYRFLDGRFWGWEGVGCCAGTCGHVWYYAQAMARLFPELERILRERVDFGLAMKPDGEIRFRAENNTTPAIDGESGSVLRALREHQMSADDAFLKRVWPGVKKATGWLIAQDGNGDGIIEGAQHNTLDSNWYGAVAWLSGIYQAALLAAAEMADEMNDPAFAQECRGIAEKGRANLLTKLFNGEYFDNKVDPAHLDAINSGTGCEIDQVIGQSWAFQAGLPRVLPEKETRTALKSLWRYNFSPDVGRYRAVNKPGRWYAMAGEAGLLMCTFPRTDWSYDNARGKGNPGFAGYFNECMNGFEHQVAGHMIWEGMLLEGLAVERAVHDRYHPSKRNPWNEIECGDHYARSMASYGVFLAACGYEYHGPKGHLGFAPRLTPEDFKAPFTAAEGWGSYRQKQASGNLEAALSLKYGSLRLKTASFALAHGTRAKAAGVKIGDTAIPASLSQNGDRVLVTFATPLVMHAGQTCEFQIA